MKRVLYFLFTGFLPLVIHAQTLKQITLEDLFINNTFKQESVTNLYPMNDGEHYTTLSDNQKILKQSYKTGEIVDVIFDLSKIDKAPISRFSEYSFSSDETKILLVTNKKMVYRRSFTADYYVWNSVTEELHPLSDDGQQRMALFSPDGDRIAFVRDNNIYIKNLKFGTESQVTWDGKQNEIINGLPDWVYEEEFGFNKAFWWSPDSKFIAYIRFDEKQVPEYSMTIYAGEDPDYTENSHYSGFYTFRYPKAGESNASVAVKSYELHTRKHINVELGNDSNIYIPRLTWSPDSKNLVVMRLNRRQNQLDILYANPFTGETKEIHSEKNSRFIDESFIKEFNFLPDGRLIMLSERTGWSHLYLYDEYGFEIGALTKGEYDVTDFYGYDPLEKLYYYRAAGRSPLGREVYYTDGIGKRSGILTPEEGTNKVSFSSSFNYYINYYSNSKSPEKVTVFDKKHNPLRVLQDNTLLKNRISEFAVPEKEFFSFTTSEGVLLNGYMLRSKNFNPTNRYPVLISQYSGPNSQKANDVWYPVGWEHYLAQEGFLVVCVDPRGTAARGEEFRKSTYMQLGKLESDDMIETAKYLKTLPYVDKSNIAIFGWSYGGFTALLSMGKGGDLFKAGVAVAPVTGWRFYDTIYTERFMRTPRENPEGYDENSPLAYADKIKGRVLLIHGTADDNVHLHNTLEFSEKLVQADIQFDMAIYTNRNHSIRGGNTSMHLYRRMTDFLKQQLTK